MKKGTFQSDTILWDKYVNKINVFKRATILISLLYENNNVAMSWSLLNAFPVKLTVSDMKSDSNEAAVESMEIAYEGMTLVQ